DRGRGHRDRGRVELARVDGRRPRTGLPHGAPHARRQDPALVHGLAGSGRLRPRLHETDTISSSWRPPGACMRTLSPTSLPSSALASGARNPILPWPASASSTPTIS